MTELDGELPQTVKELIDEFGKELSYQAFANTEYDPATGSGEAVGKPSQIKGIVEDYSSGGIGISNGLIESGDKKITLAALDFDVYPSASDTFAFDGDTYTVVRVKTIYSGELAAMHEAQLRI